jgi:hypothetical protein
MSVKVQFVELQQLNQGIITEAQPESGVDNPKNVSI